MLFLKVYGLKLTKTQILGTKIEFKPKSRKHLGKVQR